MMIFAFVEEVATYSSEPQASFLSQRNGEKAKDIVDISTQSEEKRHDEEVSSLDSKHRS